MPDITFPGTFPYSDGDTATATQINQLLYKASAFDESLGIINGQLDEDNILATHDVEAEHTQRGSSIFAVKAATTASLDYFATQRGIFGDHDSSTWSSTDLDEARVIPGGATPDFYMPWDGYVMLKWTAFWTNTSNADGVRSVVFMTFDDTYQTNQHRTVGRCENSSANPPVHEGYKCSRCWSGHLMIAASAGWHNAALKIIGDEDAEQTRVWARNILATPIKYVS